MERPRSFAMENASISDIMWNLQSAFQEATFQGAEDELVKREQQLKSENAGTKAKYDALFLANETLKRQLEQLRRQRGGFKESYSLKDPDKIRRLETEIEAARRGEREAKDEAAKVSWKARVLEEEMEGNRKKIGVLEAEKAGALEKVGVSEKMKAEAMEKVGVLEKIKAEAMEKVGVLEKMKAEAMKKVGVLEREKAETIVKVGVLEKGKAEAMEKIGVLEREKAEAMEKVGVLEKGKAEAMEKVGVLEKEEARVRVGMERVLERVGELQKEKEETIALLEREKLAAEVEKGKKIARCKERINKWMNVEVPNLSGSFGVFDGVHTDVEDNLDADIKEGFNSQDPVHTPKLSGQNACRSATIPVINISDSESDDDGVHSPNGLKRKRDSSGSSSTRLVEKANKRVTKERESETPRKMISGSAHHSPPPVGSAYDQSPSRSIDTGKCSDEEAELTSDAQWQFEADMLNAFEEHPILTMEAVCALYRHQKSCGLGYGLGLSRNRGFDAVHASRGMALAEFLLDGNPLSRMKKTLEELQLHDPKGLDDCKSIASAHSGKLFAIYQMQEDPYFGPE